MAKAVLDTTVLVSALLRHVPGGASCELLRLAQEGAYELYLSDDILEETARVLLTSGRIRRRYRYSVPMLWNSANWSHSPRPS